MTDRNDALEAVAEEPNAAAPALTQYWADLPERDETWRPVAPLDGCTFSGYECSDKGQYRSVDRTVGNRNLKGKVLATRRNDDGYVLVNIRCDSTDPDHNRVHTFTGHRIVLTTFDRPCPPGMEARHSRRGPAFNWWPEGFEGGWGTKKANHADQVEAGTAVVPSSFPCRNAARCGGTVKNEGRRCLDCVAEVGEMAGMMLAFGMPLPKVAERFGYKGDDWVFKLAVEHGRYDGSKAQARAQHPTLSQRVSLWWFLRGVHDV